MRTDLLLRTLRRTLVPLVVIVLVVSGPVIGTSRGAPEAPRIVVATPPSTMTTVPAPPSVVPVSTRLATPRGEVPTFAEPAGEPVGTVGRWYGYPMTMPIVEQRVGWLRIRLPERPNGSTAWVRLEDVALSSTPYRIVISLAETKLTVFKDGFELFMAPVGIGHGVDPYARGKLLRRGDPEATPRGLRPGRARHQRPLGGDRQLGGQRGRHHIDPRSDLGEL